MDTVAKEAASYNGSLPSNTVPSYVVPFCDSRPLSESIGYGGNPGGYCVSRPQWCVPVDSDAKAALHRAGTAADAGLELRQPYSHAFDAGRAQEAMVDRVAVPENGTLKDWNEMYQSYLELPSSVAQVWCGLWCCVGLCV